MAGQSECRNELDAMKTILIQTLTHHAGRLVSFLQWLELARPLGSALLGEEFRRVDERNESPMGRLQLRSSTATNISDEHIGKKMKVDFTFEPNMSLHS